MNKKNYGLLLSSILFIAFAIRIIGINQPINEDELHWAYSAESRDWLGTTMRNSPLSIYAMNTITSLLGVNTQTIKLTFILAGIATILVASKLAKEQYGQKTALLTASLLAINPLHILASLQTAYEGSFLTLFFASTLYCIFRYKIRRRRTYISYSKKTFSNID